MRFGTNFTPIKVGTIVRLIMSLENMWFLTFYVNSQLIFNWNLAHWDLGHHHWLNCVTVKYVTSVVTYILHNKSYGYLTLKWNLAHQDRLLIWDLNFTSGSIDKFIWLALRFVFCKWAQVGNEIFTYKWPIDELKVGIKICILQKAHWWISKVGIMIEDPSHVAKLRWRFVSDKKGKGFYHDSCGLVQNLKGTFV